MAVISVAVGEGVRVRLASSMLLGASGSMGSLAEKGGDAEVIRLREVAAVSNVDGAWGGKGRGGQSISMFAPGQESAQP